MSAGYWNDTYNIESRQYICGYCGGNIVSNEGIIQNIDQYNSGIFGTIYICHQCGCPTYFRYNSIQYPGSKYGEDVAHLPEDVKRIYNEARACMEVNAYNSVVLCCRKLLMNICVEKGADEGKKFIQYVDYLQENNYIPPNSTVWVDKIRKLGNDATHKIENRTEDEAKTALDFVSIMLKIIYEFPNRVRK